MNLIRASDSQNLQLENQAKMAEERLNASEEICAKLRTQFAGFSKKTAKYTNAATDLASVLKDLNANEQFNSTLKTTTDGISGCLGSLAKVRLDSTVFLNEEVVPAFDRHKVACKNHRISMKNICSSKERESANRRRALIRGKFSREENEDQTSHMQRALEEQALDFEKKKLVFLKSGLEDFIKGELHFHAQAIQILSDAFSKSSSINVDEDFARFKDALEETKRPARKIIRPSTALVLRRPQADDKLAFLDDESLRRINDRRCSERSSLATVLSDVLGSEDDRSCRQSDTRTRRFSNSKSTFVTNRDK